MDDTHTHPRWEPSENKYRYKALRLIGRGAFSEVLLGQRVHDGLLVALKRFKKRDTTSYRLFRREIETWHQLQTHFHELGSHIVHLLDARTTTPRFLIVGELGEMSLSHFLKRFPSSHSAEASKKRVYLRAEWIAQAIQGIRAMHRHSFVHRDIKPDNMILFDDGKTLKLCDFGFTALCRPDTEERLRTICGSPAYMAPEMTLPSSGRDGYKGFPVDVWSLGAVVYELFHDGAMLLLGNSPHEAFRNLRRGRIRPCKRKGIHILYRKLMADCLVLEPKERKRASELCIPIRKV